jgi:uncharacterized protein (TIGR03067 family)
MRPNPLGWIAVAAITIAAALTFSPAPQYTSAAPPPGDEAAAAAADLAQIQGLWERKIGEDVPGLVRATKEIRGNHETITYYGGPAGDKLLGAHEVDIKVSRRDGIRIFTYSNWVGTEGVEKGRTPSPAPVSYIYRADDNTFVEVWGFVPGQETRPPLAMMWVKKLPQTAAAAADQQALRGRWVPASTTSAAAPPEVPGDEITFNGDDFTVRANSQVQLSGVIRLNPTANPKAIDLIITQSPNGLKTGQVIRGIYELKDNGTLRWCSSPRSQTRPKDFVVHEGGNQTLTELRRAEAKP